jgi:hypothetical protein
MFSYWPSMMLRKLVPDDFGTGGGENNPVPVSGRGATATEVTQSCLKDAHFKNHPIIACVLFSQCL